MFPKEEMKDIEDEVENFVAGNFDPMEEKEEQEDPTMGTVGEGEIWECLSQQDNLQDVSDPSSLFYNDFPPLQEFQCVSSSLVRSSSVASSSAASMDDAFSQSISRLELDIDCMDVMENFGLDTTGFWDPSSIFDTEIENPERFQQEEQNPQPHHQEQAKDFQERSEQKPPVDELGAMFFEWLKNNKDYISADDMRSIKIKKTTIQSASKRLGCTKEGQKKLLQLILQWVEKYQLHKKATTQFCSFQYHQDPCFQNQNPIFSPNSNFDPDACLSRNPSCFPPPLQQLPPFYGNSPSGSEYNSSHSWVPIQYNPYMENSTLNSNLQPMGVYGDCPYSYAVNGNVDDDQRLMRQGKSATKEARKKRMARQKRVLSHNRNANQNHNQGEDQCEGFINGGDQNWVICSPRVVSACVYPSQTMPVISQGLQAGPMTPVMDAGPVPVVDQPPAVMHAQKCNRQVPLEKRQGFKPEKSLKFLLQKVLKQSDVGSLGRIVLPKREAETHLPKLEARDGIPISMEDIGTSRVWNLRYRFWPNNKSRMYLLENTGDFVKANGLQAEDFIVIYLDVKSGKYLIRGVKVRQPGQKSQGKKPARRNQRSSAKAGN